MILYLDTSALVKLFVVEAHSDWVRQAISRARLTATHASPTSRPAPRSPGGSRPRDDALFPAAPN